MRYRHTDLAGLYALTIIMLIVSIGTLSLARQYPERNQKIGSSVPIQQDSLRADGRDVFWENGPRRQH